MTKRNFEDIDKLFREGLNPQEELVTFQEGDWSKLKNRLDRNEKKKRGIFWLSRLSGVAALILLFFVLRMLLPEGGQKQATQQAEVQQQIDQKIKEEQNQPTVSPEDKKIVIKTEPSSSKWLAQNKFQKEQSAKKLLPDSTLEKIIAGYDTLKVENLNVQKATTEPTANPKEHNPSQPYIVKTPDQKRSSGEDTVGVKNLNDQKAIAKPTVNPKEHNPSQPYIAKTPDQKRSSAEESIYAAIDEPIQNPIPERSIRKLALSLLAAPDYNGVNNLNNSSLGNDFGLMVTLEIAKNWNLSTGGVYAKKLYQTGFSNYNPKKNIWTEYFPNSVSADCRVLDIPLNINYKFIKRKNNSISAGSGISSYIMLKEDYRFNYVENDGNTPLAYQVVNENQHWLSVLNLQATFEQRLNSRLSISLQPYMKIPLRNIGFAGVKLQSFGMAANLNWNFNL